MKPIKAKVHSDWELDFWLTHYYKDKNIVVVAVTEFTQDFVDFLHSDERTFDVFPKYTIMYSVRGSNYSYDEEEPYASTWYCVFDTDNEFVEFRLMG